MPTDGTQRPARSSRLWLRSTLLVVVLGTAVAVYVQFGETLTLENLSRQEVRLREFRGRSPVAVYGIAFVAYTVVTGLSLPVGMGMSLLFGWYFGLVEGLILVSFASTAGATLAFLFSRFLFRDTIQRQFGTQLANVNQALEREGAYYLFLLRLLPAVPYFVINAVMGLTPIRTWTFWWVSQLGMLPATCVYIYAGSSVPSLERLAGEGIHSVLSPAQLTRMVIAFALLGIFPLAVRLIMRAISPTRIDEAAVPRPCPGPDETEQECR